jgi:hypothetical protein
LFKHYLDELSPVMGRKENTLSFSRLDEEERL